MGSNPDRSPKDDGGPELEARGRVIVFPRRPLVMGIVNINDDSFCGDGTLDAGAALETARAMAESGADIIDVGAESARTNRAAVSEEEEAARLEPFVVRYREFVGRGAPADAEQVWPPLLSINTWRPGVVASVLPLGGDILNDMGGLPTARNAQACVDHGAALLLMHTVGEPKVAHDDQRYDDLWGALEQFFEEKIESALAAGLPRERLILDPGIGFAKGAEDDLQILGRLGNLSRFRRPVLVPVSRKEVIGSVLGIPEAKGRDAGTVACIVAAMLRGGHIFRVHDVPAAAKVVKTVWTLED